MNEKILSEAEFDNLSEDDQQAYLTSIQNESRENVRLMVLDEGGQEARDIEGVLHHVLLNILTRCKNDPEIIGLLKNLIGDLEHLTSFGASDAPLSEEKIKELRAILLGCAAASEGYRDEGSVQVISPQNHAVDLRRFLNLVENRVGKTVRKPDGSTVTNLRIRVADTQSGDIVKFIKKN